MKLLSTSGWAIVVGVLLGTLFLWYWSGSPIGANRETQTGSRVLGGVDEAGAEDDVMLILAQDIGKLGEVAITKTLVGKVPPAVSDEALEYTTATLLPKPGNVLVDEKVRLDPEFVEQKGNFLKHAQVVYQQILPYLSSASAKVNVLTKLILRMHFYRVTSFPDGERQITLEHLTQMAFDRAREVPKPAEAQSWFSGSFLIGLVTALCLALSQLAKSFTETIAKNIGTSLAEASKRLVSGVLPSGSSVQIRTDAAVNQIS